MPKAHVNGINMYYEVQGQGEPVLIISGLTADHFAFAAQIPALATHFQCISPDNRGAGQSTAPEGTYTTRQMAEDAAALLDHLGIPKAHIVGHSMGGTIVQELAINFPEKVLSLAILGSFSALDEMGARQAKVIRHAGVRLQPEEFLDFMLQYCLSYRFFQVPGAVEMLKEQAMANPFPQTPAGFLGQLAACETHNTRDRLHLIKAPTLVWAGAEDILVPPRLSRLIAEKIPGADYYEMADVGHCFMWEQADATGAKLLDWLQRVSL